MRSPSMLHREVSGVGTPRVVIEHGEHSAPGPDRGSTSRIRASKVPVRHISQGRVTAKGAASPTVRPELDAEVARTVRLAWHRSPAHEGKHCNAMYSRPGIHCSVTEEGRPWMTCHRGQGVSQPQRHGWFAPSTRNRLTSTFVRGQLDVAGAPCIRCGCDTRV